MSLINDALKRAGQKIERKQPEGAARTPPMQPAMGSTGESANSTIKLILCCLLVATLVGWKLYRFFGKASRVKAAVVGLVHKTNETAKAETPVRVNPADMTNNNPLARAKRTFDKVAAIHAEGDANASFIDQPKTGASTAPSSALAKSTADPKYKLQAIFYRANNPTALINGKSLSVGQEVDGAKIKDISRDIVTIEYGGETKMLSMH